ncbi:queuosine salvage protein-like [Nylanderia fulva]|uniref:queuosine salvage protein-like n=1 Tax=Nylanderia fulva TaxID=613905 RepID=UPI0010FAF3B0|nr:queuosine salvage protein-like [Nylanderia fulva]XP_029169856.1 queuosine salvage protein-like [Nylanderia fulva]XP_029169857.1 queuosine salvage protein-like [Nylanderia fulva]
MAEGISSDYAVMKLWKAMKLIKRDAQDVFIIEENIPKVAEMVVQYILENINYFYLINNNVVRLKSTYPCVEVPMLVDWIFVLHTLNFSLWYPKGTRQWKVDGKKGYCGLCIAIKRAIEDGKPIWNPEYYTKMTKSELKCILQSDDGEPEIPLIDERLRILHEVGEVLLQKYKGTFMECLKLSEYDADKLMKLLFDEFESYRDEVIYDGKKVRFLAKARSLVCDIWEYFQNKLLFKLNTSKMVSAIFIDYCIPQVLFKLELISYSERLVERFANNDEPLEHGSREEIEIRGCSLFAAKEISKEVNRQIQRHVQKHPILKAQEFINTQIVVDNFFLTNVFLETRNKLLKECPLHYIRSVHY